MMAVNEPLQAHQWRYYPTVPICAGTSAFIHISSMVLLNRELVEDDGVVQRLLVLIGAHLGIAAGVAALIIWLRNCFARYSNRERGPTGHHRATA